ncbi:hydroxyacid oxidase 1-like [Acanthaster planci]|uniref:(S)-2-hydroxy-acid oxidase n=1 Tax=Acanthaster planci TaxID=133434 RepID=A0A8B7YEV9_ACAPL|nr:hydroxyacid oxidase 1-like [Acanthaster planci]XP_022091122.1 hydroxyacid oxidase 1-like [Acanthaster planci]XP_022091123.1 hydroxyacid oxidase 1-like [Acanthaster planci]
MALTPVCVEDFEQYLKASVSDFFWEYYRSGAQDEQTLRDNPLAFQRYRLRPRCLRDVSQRDTSTSILGHRLAFPVGVSPTAAHCFAHKDGEVATARGVSSVGSAMILSMWSNRTLEDVAASVPPDTPLLLQLTILRDRSRVEAAIRRAEAAGFKALVVTVDEPMLGKRNYDNGKEVDLTGIKFPQVLRSDEQFSRDQIQFSDSRTWNDILRLKELTSLPFVLKGILTAEDAVEAVRHGAAGILVSNHGGRQLDGVPATIDVLAEIVNAVRGSGVEVYLDGGVRKGTDVLKALALGARAVFIGRPALWGLAYDGANGVEKVLGILKEELSLAMALSGCSSVADITSDLIAVPSYCKL